MKGTITGRHRRWILPVVLWLAISGFLPSLMAAQEGTPETAEVVTTGPGQHDGSVEATEPAVTPTPTLESSTGDSSENEPSSDAAGPGSRSEPQSREIGLLALDSGTSDPNVSIDITNLTIDCDSTGSFTLVVNVNYPRFEGNVIVDTYDGDPDAGGTIMAAISPFEGLPSGSTAWSGDLGAFVDTLNDPYIHVRWVVTAWNGDSGLDYVGEWRGSEKAIPATDCQTPPTETPDPSPTPTPTVTPSPLDILIQSLIAVLSAILAGLLGGT